MYVAIALATLVVTMLFNLTAGASLQSFYGLVGVALSEAGFAFIALFGALGMVFYARYRERTLARQTPPQSYEVCEIADIFGFRLPHWQHLLGGVCLIAGSYMVSILYTNVASVLFPDLFSATSQGISDTLYSSSLASMLVGAALLPAMCEELLFRGLTQFAFEKEGQARLAILLTALLFGVYHLSLIRIPLMIFIGLMLCYAMYRSRSILVPMLMHFLNNAVSVILSSQPQDTTQQAAAALGQQQGFLMALAAGQVAVLAWVCLAAGAMLLEPDFRVSLKKHWITVVVIAGIVLALAVAMALVYIL